MSERELTAERQEEPTPEVSPVDQTKKAERRPEKLMEMMAMQIQSGGSSLHSKMNSEHINKVLELSAQHDERQYDLHKRSQDFEAKDKSQGRIIFSLIAAAVFIIIVIVLFLYKDKPDVLVPILSGIGGVASGLMGGYGLGKSQSSKE